MWSALENIALRESLPSPLAPGESVNGVLVAGQIARGRHFLNHLGRRHSRPYLLKQFYSLNTDAFLRWQNEARYASLAQTPGYTYPCEEWRGGVIAPFPAGRPLDTWATATEPTLQTRLDAAATLARRLADIHAAGIVHRRLSPGSIFVSENDATIGDFGAARCRSWDDLWSDAPMPAGHLACASPESLRGSHSADPEDVHAFGALLHLIMADALPFNPRRQRLRSVFPGLIRPHALASALSIPPPVATLAEACLSHNPADRPTMRAAADMLAQLGSAPSQSTISTVFPDVPRSGQRQKVMVFIKANGLAAPLFEAALSMTENTPSLFLFVALIPGNLPSGHTQRYMGSLFKKLAHGLHLCRMADMDWSLRVLDTPAPEKTARHFVRQYRPDRILLGRSSRKTGRSRFQAEIAPEAITMQSIA